MSYSPLDTPSFEAGLRRRPDFVGVDSGGLDCGPLYLGDEREHAPWKWYEHNVATLVRGARALGVPLVIGNAGGNGTGGQLRRTLESVQKIARENGLHFTVATILADIDSAMLHAKAKANAITPLGIREPLTSETIDAMAKTTAMMGPEPIMKALEMGADVVLAGRCCDDAVYAAIPILKGVDRGIAHHLGKVLECGALCTTPTSLEHTVVATIDEGWFTVEPASPGYTCNVASVAAHGMYERENPFLQVGPGGTLDLRSSRYEQLSPVQVRVSGTRFIPDPTYRVKLEGAALVGYRVIDLLGIRDENMIASLDEALENARALMVQRLLPLTGDVPYQVFFHAYGRDAILGPIEPLRHQLPHELALVVEVVAANSELAYEICSFISHEMFFIPYKGRKATAGSLAHFVISEPLHTGPTYKFTIDHLMELEHPLECFPIEMHTL